jgi:hypothetical protein
MFNVTEAWKVTYPKAHAGILVMQAVNNPATHPELERLKRGLESQLRAQFAARDRKALETFSTIPAYTTYYKPFKKTYHVQAKIEKRTEQRRAETRKAQRLSWACYDHCQTLFTCLTLL